MITTEAAELLPYLTRPVEFDRARVAMRAYGNATRLKRAITCRRRSL